MTGQRPTAVTVAGILNIIFGSVGLLCYTCAGLSYLFFVSLADMPGGINPVRHMMDFLNREIPGYTAFLIISTSLGFLLAVLLLTSGIGLLNLQPWARVLSLLYAVVTILTQIGALIYTLGYVNPAMARWERDLMGEMARVGRPMPPGGLGTNLTFNNAMSLVVGILWIVYAIVLIVIMLQPHVSAAFAGRFSQQPEPDRGYDDRGDYERRPRRDQWGY